MPDNALLVGPLDRVLSLKTNPLFEELASRELVAIAQRMRERFIPGGTLLLPRGTSLTASYLLLDGRVELATESELHSLGKGDSIGFLELLAREPFPADVRTVVDTLVLELDADDQEDIWEDHFLIMLEHIKYLAREILTELRDSPGDPGEPSQAAPSVAFEGPLNLVERILTLHRIPMLSSQSIDAVAELSGHLAEIRLEDGERLWREGDAPEHFWIVLDGKVCTGTHGAARGSVVGRGSCLGLEEVLADVAHWNESWGEDRLLALRIAREPFIDVLEDHSPMARELLMRMAKRLLSLRSNHSER